MDTVKEGKPAGSCAVRQDLTARAAPRGCPVKQFHLCILAVLGLHRCTGFSLVMESEHLLATASLVAAAAAKSLQSCPTLCDPIDGSPPGSAILGILQARTLEWVAISFSNA